MTNIGGYEAFEDHYCYKGSTVLKNRLGLRDQALLDAFELEMTALRAREPLPRGKLDARQYKAIHRHLFQDVYEWAGQYRTVRTAKGGNTFCYPEYIPTFMDALFAGPLKTACLSAPAPQAFIEATARFLEELNAIHPFREGNGRAQLAFVDLLSHAAGYPLTLTSIEPDRFRAAMIESFHGRLEPLVSELSSLLP